jgi:hypothetical protein
VSDHYAPSARVLVSHLEDEAVLLHLGTKSYYRLNGTGAHIWKLLEAGSSVDDIVQSLIVTFDVEQLQAQAAVTALIDELIHNTLIEPTSD